MKLYHGSNLMVTEPRIAASKPNKDFGQGFYLSDNYEQAHQMAGHKVDQLRIGVQSVSVFEFDETLFNSDTLRVKRFDDYCVEWGHFVLTNRDRRNTTPPHTFDIVIGPIADDGVTFQLRRYSQGILTMEQLVEELKFARGRTMQYFFGTETALSHLIPTDK